MEGKEIKIKFSPKIFWYLVFILLIIFLAVLFRRVFLTERYVGVYFLNGELYFGRISYFPRLKLSSPHILRIDQNGNSTLVPLVQLNWGPKNYIYLNKNQVLWIAPLSENSQVLTLIRNQSNSITNYFGPVNQPRTPQNNQFIQNQPPVNQSPSPSNIIEQELPNSNIEESNQ
jgi:hypothetical protein